MWKKIIELPPKKSSRPCDKYSKRKILQFTNSREVTPESALPRHDLADDRPDLVRSMTDAFEKWFDDVEKDYRIAAKEKQPPV